MIEAIDYSHKRSEQPIYFVDFDFTLFDTRLFSDVLFSSLATASNLPFNEVATTSSNYYTHPTLGGYDIAKHAMSIGVSPEIVWPLLDDVLKNDFLYGDSNVFLEELVADGNLVTILSFGEQKFQLAKIGSVLERTSKSVQDATEVHIVQERKTNFIQRFYPRHFGMLIDDVPSQNLPEGILEVHIQRGGMFPTPVWNSEAQVAVSSLQMVTHYSSELVSRAFTSLGKKGILVADE